MKPESKDAFKIQYDMLKLTGGWLEEGTTISYKIKGFLIYFMSIILGTTMLMEAYADRNDFTKLSEILYIMITVLAYCVKHFSIFVRRKSFVRMVKILRDPALSSYPDDLDYIMAKRIRFSQILANGYRLMCVTYLFLMSLSPFFDKTPLPFPFPYDLGPYRPFMYAFQVFAIGTNAWNNSCLDCLIPCVIGVAATHLEILSKKIIKIKEDYLDREELEVSEKMDNDTVDKLRECVRHHLTIVEYVESIDGAFSFAILIQFFGSIIILCNTLFHVVLVSVMSSQFFMLFNYLVIMICQLFMYCWFGNEVIWKSMSIGEACYTFKWYRCGKRIKKYVFIMMERSRRPLKITAYKFSSLSLTAFTSIMQWSYSYFALLMKLYKSTPDA